MTGSTGDLPIAGPLERCGLRAGRLAAEVAGAPAAVAGARRQVLELGGEVQEALEMHVLDHRHEQAVVPMPYQFGSGGTGKGHHGQAAGQCFGRHVAVGFGEAGEEEEVGTGVVGRQILAGTHAGETVIGVFGAQAGAGGTVADPHHARVGTQGADGGKGPARQIEILFRRQPADVEAGKAPLADAPGRAQGAAAARRVGELMCELSDNATPNPSFRFYV